jgi:hypothetical protein
MADLVGLKSRLNSTAWATTFTSTDFVSMRNYLTANGRYNDNVVMPTYTDLSNTYAWAYAYTIACACDCAVK